MAGEDFFRKSLTACGGECNNHYDSWRVAIFFSRVDLTRVWWFGKLRLREFGGFVRRLCSEALFGGFDRTLCESSIWLAAWSMKVFSENACQRVVENTITITVFGKGVDALTNHQSHLIVRLYSRILATVIALGGVSLFVAGIGKLTVQDELPIFGSIVLPHAFVPIVGLFEMVIGSVLVFLPGKRWGTVLGFFVFGLFLVVLLGRSINDTPFCNCFPAVEIPIWIMLLFDSLCLLACLMTSLQYHRVHTIASSTDERIIPFIRRFGRSMIYAFSILALFALSRSWTFERGIAEYTGKMIAVDQSRRARFVNGDTELMEVPFRLSNLGSVPSTIIGAKSSCGCIAIDGLPVQLKPKDSFTLNLKIATATMEGKSRGTFSSDVFFSDQRKPVRLTVDLFVSK